MKWEWTSYGDGRCENVDFGISGFEPLNGFSFDGIYSPSGNVYYETRVTFTECGLLCADLDWCNYFSFKHESLYYYLHTESWCFLAFQCPYLVNSDNNGYDNSSNLYKTYKISSEPKRKPFKYLLTCNDVCAVLPVSYTYDGKGCSELISSQCMSNKDTICTDMECVQFCCKK